MQNQRPPSSAQSPVRSLHGHHNTDEYCTSRQKMFNSSTPAAIHVGTTSSHVTIPQQHGPNTYITTPKDVPKEDKNCTTKDKTVHSTGGSDYEDRKTPIPAVPCTTASSMYHHNSPPSIPGVQHQQRCT